MIYSRSREEYWEHLRQILETLRKEKLFENFSKCEFWLWEVQFLGCVISENSVQVDPTKDWGSEKRGFREKLIIDL